MNRQRIPRLAVTVGEPAGIGPDICVKIAQRPYAAELIFITDPGVLVQRGDQLGLETNLRSFDPSTATTEHVPGSMCVLPIEFTETAPNSPPNPKNAPALLNGLDIAIDGCISGQFDAMVTGPIDKSVINRADIPFSGHTEYLAQKTNTNQVVMLLATESLRVALVTTHIPLNQVSDAISKTHLERVIRILHHDLVNKYQLPSPIISVCGLNPHAGEGGYIGTEELDTIIPVLDQLRREGFQLIGPLPADTAFTPSQLKHCDAVLAMYHDQGLPVLKHVGFGNAINITLGLPLIRTSVDHGTAYDLAGTGNADAGSLNAAIKTAIELVNRKLYASVS